ncbi:MAG: D-mannonate oxidoreductase, partial [Ignavibacteria bacterium]|nr:D-mannonate oxidoreductase [Ignavibacteria bacterium]
MNKYSFDDIKGKVVVLTGGGGVIGSAFTMGLASAGAKIAVVDFNKDNAQKVAD